MNIYLLNTLAVGIDTSEILFKHLDIKGVIGLKERTETESISGYVYQKHICEKRGVPFIEMQSYNLSNDADKSLLLGLPIDLIIVCGWQRLVPDWLIAHSKIGVVGFHGSPFGITQGRGRSPQNWALMLGLNEFYLSIFKIDPGIDSGAIIDTRKFVYTPFDDIKTSYYKISLLTAEMLIQNIRNGRISNPDLVQEQEGEAFYFPQRLPEDGFIDWNRSSQQIYNFVRSLTRPYPAARTKLGDQEWKIWYVIPFEVPINSYEAPGTVEKVFYDGNILVRTQDGFLLIKDYEPVNHSGEISEGMEFESVPFIKQLSNIVERHKKKFPDYPVTPAITEQLIQV